MAHVMLDRAYRGAIAAPAGRARKKEALVKRFWDRPERMLDALVIGVALPTIAIAGSLGSYDGGAKDRVSVDYKVGRGQCDSRAGSARDSCVAFVKTQSGR